MGILSTQLQFVFGGHDLFGSVEDRLLPTLHSGVMAAYVNAKNQTHRARRRHRNRNDHKESEIILSILSTDIANDRTIISPAATIDHSVRIQATPGMTGEKKMADRAAVKTAE